MAVNYRKTFAKEGTLTVARAHRGNPFCMQTRIPHPEPVHASRGKLEMRLANAYMFGKKFSFISFLPWSLGRGEINSTHYGAQLNFPYGSFTRLFPWSYLLLRTSSTI